MSTRTVESVTIHLALNCKSTEVSIDSLPSVPGTILLLHEALGSVGYWKAFRENSRQPPG